MIESSDDLPTLYAVTRELGRTIPMYEHGPYLRPDNVRYRPHAS